METNNHYFYVLQCRDGSFYGGYTNHLEKRITRHNEGNGAKYTRARKPVLLLHSEQYSSKQEAMSKEYSFKQLSRKEKEQYLAERGVRYVATEKL
jgi:putative endonuclease